MKPYYTKDLPVWRLLLAIIGNRIKYLWLYIKDQRYYARLLKRSKGYQQYDWHRQLTNKQLEDLTRGDK